MKSAVRRVLILSALMSPSALYALGLGEIHLHSALNQPFDADIDLVSAADEDLSALRASLASNDAFARYGIDKPGFLSDFTFRVVRGPGGRDYLKVTSPRPVTEPFVTLLVAAEWPRGRLLREYTVLLDPPIFAPSPQAAETPVTAPRASTPQAPAAAPGRGPAPSTAASTAGAQARPASAQPPVAPGTTYRVRTNDTLWKIAADTYPGTRSDVNRAMVAIYEANPHAFGGNINVLRAGSTLRLPEADAVAAIPASAAAAEVSRQYRVWKEGSTAAQPAEAEAGRLRLVTPEQGTAAPSSVTTPTPSATPAAGASTTELQSRVQQLESELAEAKRLLEVRNAELATLQGQAAAGQQGAAPSTAGATAAETTAPAEEAAAPPQAQPAAPPKPAAKKKAPAQPAAAPSMIERLAGYWWVVLGLLAAALAFFLYRRSRSESGDKEVDLQEALARTRTDLRARPMPRDAAIIVEERRQVEPAAAPRVSAPAAPRGLEPTRKPVSIDDTISGEEAVSIEAGDPLAEADFHMAYGLYDQAADLVQLAIKRTPQRRELKLKLLEIYFVWGNRDRFVELAGEMNASRGDAQPGEWDKILIMGRQIAPENPMFSTAPGTLTGGLDMELHGSQGPLDMDLGGDQVAAPDLDLAGSAAAASEGGLDFEVGESGAESGAVAPTVEMPRVKVKKAPSEEPTQEVAIEDLGLDVGDAVSLDDAEGGEDLLAARPRDAVEDTVESPRIAPQPEPGAEDDEAIDATGILMQPTAILKGLDATGELPQIQLGDTGELPTIETTKIQEGPADGVDFDLGAEPSTMSEVGTKLDLARAYVDMGDPEGARSILDEVMKEGSDEQKKEAERLMASLP